MPGDTPDFTQGIVFLDQQQGMYSGSQYGSFLGNGVFLTGTAFPASNVYGTCISYTVPVGQTFYLQGLSYGAQAASQLLYCAGRLQQNGVNVLQLINIGGQSLIFDTPIPFAAGNVLTFAVLEVATAAAAANVYGNIWGWRR